MPRWLVGRGDGAVLDAVVERVFHRGPTPRGVDDPLQQPADGRQQQEEKGRAEGEVHEDGDEDVAHAQVLLEVEARAVELGHQRAAAVDDRRVGDARWGGRQRAHVAHGAHAEDFAGEGCARDILGGCRGDEREWVHGFGDVGEGGRVEGCEDCAERAAACAGAPIVC